jgi:hypothetical protein
LGITVNSRPVLIVTDDFHRKTWALEGILSRCLYINLAYSLFSS